MAGHCQVLALLTLTVVQSPGSRLCEVGQCQANFVHDISQSVNNTNQSLSCRTVKAALECGRQLLTSADCSQPDKDNIREKISQGQQFVGANCQQDLRDCDVDACMSQIMVNVSPGFQCRSAEHTSWCLLASVLYKSNCYSHQQQFAQEMIDKTSLFMISNCPLNVAKRPCDPVICYDKTAAAGNSICSVGRAFLACVDTDLTRGGSCTDQEQEEIQAAKSEVSKYLLQRGCTAIAGFAGHGTLTSMTLCLSLTGLVSSLTNIHRSSL